MNNKQQQQQQATTTTTTITNTKIPNWQKSALKKRRKGE